MAHIAYHYGSRSETVTYTTYHYFSGSETVIHTAYHYFSGSEIVTYTADHSDFLCQINDFQNTKALLRPALNLDHLAMVPL